MSELLSNLVDEALERLKSGEPIDAILADYPTHRDALAPLLSVAQELSTLKHIPPSPSGAVSLANFLADAQDMAIKARTTRRSTRRLAHRMAIVRQSWYRPRTRLALGIGATIVLLFAIIGVTFQLSSRSLPGDWLYPAKLAGEELHLFFAHDQVAQTEYRMVRARNRVYEIRKLVETGRTVPETTLDRLDRSLLESLNSVALVEDSEMRRLLADLETMVSEQTAALLELEGETSQQARPLLAQTRQSLEQTRTFASAGQADVNAFRLNAQLSAFKIGWPGDEPAAGGLGIPAHREEPQPSPQPEVLPRVSPLATQSPAASTYPVPTMDIAAGDFTFDTPPSFILVRTATPTSLPQTLNTPEPQPTDAVQPSATSAPTIQAADRLQPSATSQPAATDQDEPGQELTKTPRPTKTPKPTKTARPTKTPKPSDTPGPTDTPEPAGAIEPGETPQPSENSPPAHLPHPTKPPKPAKTPKS